MKNRWVTTLLISAVGVLLANTAIAFPVNLTIKNNTGGSLVYQVKDNGGVNYTPQLKNCSNNFNTKLNLKKKGTRTVMPNLETCRIAQNSSLNTIVSSNNTTSFPNTTFIIEPYSARASVTMTNSYVKVMYCNSMSGCTYNGSTTSPVITINQ